VIQIPVATGHQKLGVIQLARDDRAPYLAREAVTAWTGPAHPARETLILVASELVTNSVKHAAGLGPSGDLDWIELTLSQGPDFLRLVVTDPGSACSAPSCIPMQASNLYAEQGRGLAIVDNLSRGRWGSYRLPASGHHVVWCHLDPSPTPAQLEELFHGPTPPHHLSHPLSESAMPDLITPAVATQAATHLTNLQKLLQNLGLHARLLTQDERLPCLRVINPEAATLSEVITAAPKDNQWLFWWSWAEPIVEVSQPATAAARIHHVLATARPSVA
jgi:anti-sigma regulatory factor (Ser/Thr protein kinase)